MEISQRNIQGYPAERKNKERDVLDKRNPGRLLSYNEDQLFA